MHPYRTHRCSQPRTDLVGTRLRLSGWVHRIRDHGGVLFLDLRDHYGITQCVADQDNSNLASMEKLKPESVVTVTGTLQARPPETINSNLPTGEVELVVEQLTLVSEADTLPFPVHGNEPVGEDMRYRHRYIDLRREEAHQRIMLRTAIIDSARRRMKAAAFNEIQTPILTVSSPEGARDYLVPSRLHPGSFYALPQAPQIFKQLLMVSGFDRYFQIAPCFRDEDARADRAPGDFYQLDLEMSFVTQEDVFATVEPILLGIFEEFATGRLVDSHPVPRFSFEQAMLQFGTDKPDLRNPLRIQDVTTVFADSGFGLFARGVAAGSVVRAIPCSAASQPRSFFDGLNDWARDLGAGGLGYIIFEGEEAKGPIAKHLDTPRLTQLRQLAEATGGDTLFFACAKEKDAAKWAGLARTRIGDLLGLIEPSSFRFCWITDYPMFEWDEDDKAVVFSHNPFSMPQGGMDALVNNDPLTIKASQYDFVCNGFELLSGAIRNHLPEVFVKAMGIAGFDKDEAERRFGGLLKAFRYGVPPHGGVGVGLDRIIMLLADAPNLREIYAFPLNQQGQDLMLGAPTADVSSQHLKLLGIQLAPNLLKKLG
ncbi:MAG: aspartate--tRNA ligase [Alphaproteobacteria bacterium]|nr:aspartate--tRNA ligase [Alphaproteobacteria bacterium]